MKKLILLIALCSLLTNCSTFRNIFKKETNKERTQSTISEKDSTSLKTVNGEIKDNFSLKVPRSFSNDSINDLKVNKRVNQILGSIDISKTSGKNSYRVWWDSKQERIRVYFNIAKTENSSTQTNKKEDKQLTVIEQIKEEWTKTKLPWWFYALLVFFFRKSIISTLGFFIPGLKTASSIQDIIKKS